MGRRAARGVCALLLALLLTGLTLAQTLQVGGSSTLFPASAEFAGQVEEALSGTTIEVSFAGTGGGFELFCKGAMSVIGASRLATEEETRACAQSGVEFVAFPVALDAVVLVVSEENDWLGCLTLDEVRRLWSGDADGVDSWAELRPGLPDRPISFHAPGVASGTYDYWNRVVLGQGTSMRTDYFPNEDDRRLAQLTAEDRDAVTFFGRAQLHLAGAGLEALEVDDGFGCVDPRAPGEAAARWPFVRPLFLYVAASAVAPDSPTLAAVEALVNSFLSLSGQERLRSLGYLPLDEQVRRDAAARFAARTTGPLAADYDGQALLRLLPGGWTRRQVELRDRLLSLERQVEAVSIVHRRPDPLLQGLLDGGRGTLDDPLQ